MKVICDRTALEDAVALVGSVVATRTPQPVLHCMKLAAADGRLCLAATDLEVGLRLSLDDVQIDEPGEALVPADKLAQIVRASEDPTITIETDGNTMHIRGSDSHFKMFGLDPKEAPEVRNFDAEKVDCQIDGASLRTMITRTIFAAANEHSRYAINGVLFDREGGKLKLVATDGRRLAIARGQCDGDSGQQQCIVPSKALTLLSKLVGSEKGTIIRISLEESQVIFGIGAEESFATLTSNLVEGSFPPYEDVIPKEQDKRVTFDKSSLFSAIKRAALLTNEESRGVRLHFEGDTLTLRSRAPEMGEAEVQLNTIAYEGDPVEIGFNPSFITDALRVVDTDEVMVELKAPNKPGVLRTGNDFTYVIMPVNL